MPRTLLAPVSYGLGDLVVSLPAVQALIGEGQPVWLVARAPAQRLLAERIAGLAGVVDEAELGRGTGDRFIDLRDHPLQRDYWWGSAAFEAESGPMNINQILQLICRDFGINADFQPADASKGRTPGPSWPGRSSSYRRPTALTRPGRRTAGPSCRPPPHRRPRCCPGDQRGRRSPARSRRVPGGRR